MSELSQIAPGLWAAECRHSIMGVSIGRRMVVVQLPNGTLQLHSPIPVNQELKHALDELGPVQAILAPTCLHDTFVREAFAAFPNAELYAPHGFAELDTIQPLKMESAPEEWHRVLEWTLVAGMPKVNEYMFLHKPTRTLLVSDLVFNIGPEADAWTRTFFRLNGAYDRLRPTRLFRAMIRDRQAFRESIHRVMEWDFDRLIMSHGRIVETGAKERLRDELAPCI